jgi:hypothetical protein
VFVYDDVSGALEGPDAFVAAQFIAAAREMRFVSIDPHPSSHRLGPEPHSFTDIAAIFGQFYELPFWLAELRPSGRDVGNQEGLEVY